MNRMMDTSEQNNFEPKASYEAPQLRVIELATDEVLGVGCKVDDGPGPSGFCNSGPCGTTSGS